MSTTEGNQRCDGNVPSPLTHPPMIERSNVERFLREHKNQSSRSYLDPWGWRTFQEPSQENSYWTSISASLSSQLKETEQSRFIVRHVSLGQRCPPTAPPPGSNSPYLTLFQAETNLDRSFPLSSSSSCSFLLTSENSGVAESGEMKSQSSDRPPPEDWPSQRDEDILGFMTTAGADTDWERFPHLHGRLQRRRVKKDRRQETTVQAWLQTVFCEDTSVLPLDSGRTVSIIDCDSKSRVKAHDCTLWLQEFDWCWCVQYCPLVLMSTVFTENTDHLLSFKQVNKSSAQTILKKTGRCLLSMFTLR